MRRTISALLLVAGLTVGTTAPVTADPTPAPVGSPAPAPAELPDPATDVAEEAAEEALETAEQVLEGEAPGVEPTLALADLVAAMPSLDRAERRQARALLARPVDGGAFAGERQYDRTPVSDCRGHFCLHFVRSGGDAPSPLGLSTDDYLAVLQEVRRHHVEQLGYRRPPSDGNNGGGPRSGLFDVYLMDLAPDGMYGYCVPEKQAGHRNLASSYCVLDNDFATRQYGGTPDETLRVTAAHELFHAVQFGYDFTEDGWLKEATATWVEERFADGVDDNRQYLRYGQVGRPGRPLDVYDGGAEYGNWAFFEYLSQRFGVGFVRGIWNRAADFRGAPDRHSIGAVTGALGARRVAFPTLFAQYAAGNTMPDRTYAEGGAWGLKAPARGYRLTAGRVGTGPVRRTLHHLTSQSIAVVRDDSLRGRDRLLIRVDGPDRVTGSIAHALVHTEAGRVHRHVIRLGKRGNAVRRVGFGADVSRVVVTLANASTRYRCWQGRSWACQGVPRDNGRRFTVSAYAQR